MVFGIYVTLSLYLKEHLLFVFLKEPFLNDAVLSSLLFHILLDVTPVLLVTFQQGLATSLRGLFHATNDIFPVSVLPRSRLAVVIFGQVDHRVRLAQRKHLMPGCGSNW